MQQLLALLPTDAVVGMITYGQMCFVHELGFAEMPKAYAFRGTKSVTAAQVHRGLGRFGQCSGWCRADSVQQLLALLPTDAVVGMYRLCSRNAFQ